MTAFYMLVALGAVIVWFALSPLFRALGTLLSNIWNYTINKFTKTKEEENKEKYE